MAMAYIEVEMNIRPDDLEKVKATLQEQTDDKIVLLPVGFRLVHPKVLYECDRRACAVCDENCHLTGDISHAVNFQSVVGGVFVEKRGDENGPV